METDKPVGLGSQALSTVSIETAIRSDHEKTIREGTNEHDLRDAREHSG